MKNVPGSAAGPAASEQPTERIPSAERREQILRAATAVFGERGYAQATTDRVAQAAGISQPYVVRMFGSKENLFLEVLDRALGRIMESFRAVLADPDDSPVGPRLGRAYVNLIEDRGILLCLLQAFMLGHDETIGRKARQGFLAIYRLLRDDVGLDADDARRFLAEGMLINTLLAVRMTDDYATDVCAQEILESAFSSKLDLVLDVARRDSGADAGRPAASGRA
ncbi:TetR/AcrR family transcriptional regulator [Compostimonas suwonensis]|uniref:AcrR family transcriptional regulator n=1 Tax=Compostimonas suwonensis TaxID=1048394 RepID=A0A2M9BU88_9MICO|nr:TetR/AcrR family transcriptional regulator [Compostimonas suwonensis]PJJ61516.1 AcrR family transcriptional regulator [Compostimonas suwonensis]